MLMDMSTLSERIRYLRRINKASQEELGAPAGMSKQAISALEKGASKAPSATNIERLSRHWLASVEWILHGKGDAPLPRDQQVNAGRLPVFETKTDLDPSEPGDIQVDVLDLELSAGDGIAAPEFLETRYRHTYSEAWRLKKGVKSGEKLYRVPVRGNSMFPVLGNGDMVLVRPADRAIVDMSTYAIVVAGQLKVKKLVRRRDGGLEIVSCNPEYRTELVPAEELDTVHIIGRVIDKSGDSGLDG